MKVLRKKMFSFRSGIRGYPGSRVGGGLGWSDLSDGEQGILQKTFGFLPNGVVGGL